MAIIMIKAKSYLYMARMVAAIALTIIWFGVIPLYGMPFGGCFEYGYSTLMRGCSSWPEFMRGFFFSAIFFLLAPKGYGRVVIFFALFALGVFWIVVRTTGLVYEMKSVQDVVEFLRGPSPFILGGIASLFVVLGMNFYCGKDTSKSDLPLLK